MVKGMAFVGHQFQHECGVLQSGTGLTAKTVEWREQAEVQRQKEVLARDGGETLSPCVDQVFFVRDASWGGRLPGSTRLAPMPGSTSRRSTTSSSSAA